ncbi:unnamed protein product [Symbiodinium pilosum]|uniref:DUF192 domain-containing protein n=1 Tax=Symbiodinium pilosum TaxID=2952 RepID=A0A812XY07_SYMPI|nr:unnamed protein product [Symbiodinium pilosum]
MVRRRWSCWLLLLAAANGSPMPERAAAQDASRKLHPHGSNMLQMQTSDPISFREDGLLQFTGSSGSLQVRIEVPRTFSHFMRGLMFRPSLEDGTAMLFQWDQDGPRSFWMENTYMPLDIVYVNSQHKIVSIKQAMPLSTRGVPSELLASSAIEVPQGWCQLHGVRVGDEVGWRTDTPAFIARDAADFGASPAEVEEAIRDGNYRA